MNRTVLTTTRRRVAAVSSALALSVGLSACSGGSSSDAPDESKAELSVSTAAAKGDIPELNWGVPFGEPPTIDPARGGDSSVYFVMSNVCDPLVQLNPDYSMSPGLATEWEYSDDNMSLTFTLRDGVTFSNGDPMTAEDVQYSLARHLDPKLASTWGTSVFGKVASVEVSGDNAVVVNFKTPDSLFVKAMAIAPGIIGQKKAIEAAGTSYGTAAGGVVCTGAYSIDSWTPGSGMTLKANPDYWNADNQPHAETVNLKFIVESSSLVQALQSGSLDGSYDVPPSAIKTLRDAGKGTVYQGPSPQMLQIYPVEGTMSDVKLRQAVSKLIDREAIAKQVYKGSAEVNYTIVPKLLWDESSAELEPALAALDKDEKVDVAGAKKLIESMDAPPKELTMAIIAGHEQMRQTSALLQQQLADVGIKLTIKQIQPAENASYFTDPNARKGIDMIMNTGWSGVPDIMFYPIRVVTPTGIFNLLKYEDPKVTALVDEGVQSFDPKIKGQKLAEAQAIYDPQKPLIPVANPREVSYVRDGLTGLTTSFAYVYSSSLAKIGADK
jgi:peptide/nickel transport system substrate-binding protein